MAIHAVALMVDGAGHPIFTDCGDLANGADSIAASISERSFTR